MCKIVEAGIITAAFVFLPAMVRHLCEKLSRK
jgi:hypothetical protein